MPSTFTMTPGIRSGSIFNPPKGRRLCGHCEWDFHDRFPAGSALAERPQAVNPRCPVHGPTCPRCSGFTVDCDCTERQIDQYLAEVAEQERRGNDELDRRLEELRERRAA